MAAQALTWSSRPGTADSSTMGFSSPLTRPPALRITPGAAAERPYNLPDFADPRSPASPNFRDTFAGRMQPTSRGPFNAPDRIAAYKSAQLALPAAGTPTGFAFRQEALRRPTGAEFVPHSSFGRSSSSSFFRPSTSTPSLLRSPSASRLGATSTLRATPALMTLGSLHAQGVQRPSWWG